MLKRQRAILFMLEAAGRSVSRLEITQWAFLLANEGEAAGNGAFYRFVPYRYGPFSFCLSREAEGMVHRGLVEEQTARRWRITDLGREAADSTGHDVKSGIRAILDRFRDLALPDLLRYVYRQYPWFAINSSSADRMDRPEVQPAVYTTGYAGVSVDGFLDAALRRGLRQILDVRHNPISRSYGFHGGTLSRLCRLARIGYTHFPELGIPSRQRRGLTKPAEFERLFDEYENVALPRRKDLVRRVAHMVRLMPSALLCVEREPTACHRGRLATAISREARLPVCHLEPAA